MTVYMFFFKFRNEPNCDFATEKENVTWDTKMSCMGHTVFPEKPLTNSKECYLVSGYIGERQRNKYKPPWLPFCALSGLER